MKNSKFDPTIAKAKAPLCAICPMCYFGDGVVYAFLLAFIF